MGIKSMQGTSAFLEYIGEPSKKRGKGCPYCLEGKCNYKDAYDFLEKCCGQRYCASYKKIIENKNDKQFKNKSIISKPISNNAQTKSKKINLLNKKVYLMNINSDEKLLITIVNKEDENIFDDKVSVDSPIAKVLEGKRIGDIAEIKIGNKIIKYKILDIR